MGLYQGNVAATRRSWARENRTKVIAFIRSYAQAIDWLYDKANHDEAITILLNNFQMSPGIAERTYDELLDPKDGFFPRREGTLEGFGPVSPWQGAMETARKKWFVPWKSYVQGS